MDARPVDDRVRQNAGEWHRPTIKPLVRLGEQTTPTTISASSPDKHKPNIAGFSDSCEERQGS